MIFGSHCSCRYNKPLAAPIAILFLMFQSKAGLATTVKTKLVKTQESMKMRLRADDSRVVLTFKLQGDAAIGHVRVNKKPFTRCFAITD